MGKRRGEPDRLGVPVHDCRGQATTELLLVSVWFFIVVLLVIQLTVTMAGDEAASYVAYMSVRAETVGASAETMKQKLKGAIPWAGWVSVESIFLEPTTKRPVPIDSVRKMVRAPSLFLVEALDVEYRIAADQAGEANRSVNPFLVQASAEMPDCFEGSHSGHNRCTETTYRIGDNDLF